MAARVGVGTKLYESGLTSLRKMGEPAAERFGSKKRPTDSELIRNCVAVVLRHPECQREVIQMTIHDRVQNGA